MSLLSDSDLKEIHKKIIDSTIKNCGQFYNARILEAIKMRWIKIYEQKLRNKELGLVSDLSDVDPETNNIIIGVCDKISKPCGRRNVGSNWKIKLKGGLMKIDGKEMFFHGLQGELEF
ncbi:hypothetical protein PFMALIP_01778 [Plasmodium falciparum MaliPS096_E11]|uniref:Transcription initiation factor IIA subunit 1 n=1 Tax=Plasmodium falciparum MaliPS096_E11 TaxID=1036727 RepID=A0A024WUP2_PLAFA|nr:hypothetical protein PFMALIP_01778 [Plasmodium falciparum MaliPS096_E11]